MTATLEGPSGIIDDKSGYLSLGAARSFAVTFDVADFGGVRSEDLHSLSTKIGCPDTFSNSSMIFTVFEGGSLSGKRRIRNFSPSPGADDGADFSGGIGLLQPKTHRQNRIAMQKGANPAEMRDHPASAVRARNLGRVSDSTRPARSSRNSCSMNLAYPCLTRDLSLRRSVSASCH